MEKTIYEIYLNTHIFFESYLSIVKAIFPIKKK